ncbi:MAG: LysM peptidoglycan-binding domain-containing protein [Lachnospiraceae bacterium]|nr:LysM peptidoglycan-binding domain-containing protein [Lachnospiraceae bacterium]
MRTNRRTAKGYNRIMSIRLAALAVIIVLAVSILIGGMRRSANASEAGVVRTKCYTNVEVNKGDTLWAIAGEYSNDKSAAGIQACVEEIRELNNMKYFDVICSGDKLIVPYYVYE